jgi:hypothetical protein
LRAEFNRRLARVRADLREHLSNPGASLFLDPAGRVEALSRRLDARLAAHLLAGAWWERHARDAFLRGAGRSYDEARRAALQDPAAHAGGKAEFLRSLSVTGGPWGAGSVVANAASAGERLRLLVLRLGLAVKALAEQAAARVVRAVATLLSAEPRPDVLLRAASVELAAVGKRAAAVFASELTGIHAAGQLAGMAALGVVAVEAEVEWVRFAGACPRCRAMAGRRYTLAEAEGLIPSHPGCKCVWRVVRG